MLSGVLHQAQYPSISVRTIMRLPPKPSFICRFVFAMVLLFPALFVSDAGAATITYIPDLSRSSVLNELSITPSLETVVRELPSGVIVIDRGDSINFASFTTAQTIPAVSGEWYLVNTPDENTAYLSRYGTVHLRDGSYTLIEVFKSFEQEFIGQLFSKQHLQTSPPPAEAQAYAATVRQAASEIAGQPERAPSVQEYLNRGSEADFIQILREICGGSSFNYDGGSHTIASRHVEHADKTLVADYLGDILVGYGYDVSYEPFTIWGVPCRNVIATRIGVTNPAEYVIVGGHYDSTSGSPDVLAQGAEDNGSGTALVMEIARLSANVDFERTVQFVLFDAEEWGLHGSEHFVDEAIAGGRTIVGAITADMVCYYDNDYGVLIEGEEDWEWLMTAMEDNVNAYTGLATDKSYNSWGSDHVSFQNAGIPAFLAIDLNWGSYPYYHSTDDTWANIEATASIGYEITQACAATLAEVAVLHSLPSAVDEPPADWALSLSASPNPINDRGVIRFNLPHTEQGSLFLLDLSGRRVATFANGLLSRGAHEVGINALDSSGRELPGGIYYYRLETESGISESQKLIIVR
jgi:Peptidase family M28